MSKSKKHHYLSRFYLKGFSFKENESDRCFFYNIPNNTDVINASVVDVAAEKNLFTITENGIKDFSLEKAFSISEAELSKGLKSIIEIIEGNGKVGKGEKDLILDLIMFQIKRSLVVMDKVKDRMEKERDKIVRDLTDNYISVDLSKIDMEEISKTEMNKQLKSGLFEKIIGKYPIKNTLMNRNRYFFQITDLNKSFVTSDAPLYRYNIHGESEGIENKNTQVIFPLSSKIVLVIYGDGKKIFKIIKNDNEFVKRTNAMIITNASNFIIGSNEKLIKKMKKRKNGGTSKYIYPQNDFLVNIQKT